MFGERFFVVVKAGETETVQVFDTFGAMVRAVKAAVAAGHECGAYRGKQLDQEKLVRA